MIAFELLCCMEKDDDPSIIHVDTINYMGIYETTVVYG